MPDISILGVLTLGLIGGGLLGYVLGGLRRELFDRNLRHANTRLRSLELDRDLLAETLEITRRELDEFRSKAAEQDLIVVLEDKGVGRVSEKWPGIVANVSSGDVAKVRSGDAAKVGSGNSVQPDKLTDDPGRRPPKSLPVEVEEPDPTPLPELEYPQVRFG